MKSIGFSCLLVLTISILNGSVAAVETVRILSPEAGSVFHVGDTLHITFAFVSTDTLWSTQLFDFYVDGGKIRGDMGVTAGSPYADSMRSFIAAHKQFDWVIPESLTGPGKVKFSTVNTSCKIGTRPYPFTTNPEGANGMSAIFSVLPSGVGIKNKNYMRFEKISIATTSVGTPAGLKSVLLSGRQCNLPNSINKNRIHGITFIKNRK